LRCDFFYGGGYLVFLSFPSSYAIICQMSSPLGCFRRTPV
jgi:hypothetical protein